MLRILGITLYFVLVVFAIYAAFTLGTWIAWLTSAVIILNISFIVAGIVATAPYDPWRS